MKGPETPQAWHTTRLNPLREIEGKEFPLGVLGRADLTSLGVDACASLSFAFHDFACGLGWHYVSRCDNACGAILVSGEPNIGTLVS